MMAVRQGSIGLLVMDHMLQSGALSNDGRSTGLYCQVTRRLACDGSHVAKWSPV